jgi:hypothetical protein
MDKRRLYRNIAKKAGIEDPQVEYIARRKAYAIGIEMAMPRGGFSVRDIGVYETPQDAESRIAEDLKSFLQKYPEAQSKVTVSYNTVTQIETLSPKEASRELLNRLLTGEGSLTLDAHLQQMAKTTLEYLEKLEAPRVRRKAKGRYRSRSFEPKKSIEWEQPDAREAPVYFFEVDCPYCGRHVSLERFSPREPQHCGQPECYTKHERELARVRKQRQRAREKGE